MERGVTAALARATGEQDLAVFLESHPVLRMMLGEFSTVTVENTDVSVDGLAFQTVATTLQQVRMNLEQLLQERQVSAGRGRLQTVFRLSATDIENHLLVRIPNLQAAEAALLDDRILVDGTFALEGGRQLHFKTVNSLQQPDETHLALTVEQMWLNDVAIAPELARDLVEFFAPEPLAIDFGAFPVPLKITDVQMDARAIVITAQEQVGQQEDVR